MKKIIVYCEIGLDATLDETSYELLTKARELKYNAKFIAQNKPNTVSDSKYFVEAVAIGKKLNRESIIKAISSGADRVVFLKIKDNDAFNHIDMAEIFVNYHNSNPAEIIIFPATPKGRIIAPRITTMLDTGLVADCTGLEFALKKDELKLAPTRPTFGAELMATILSKKNPQCATIRPKTFTAQFVETNGIQDGQYIEIPAETSENGQKIKSFNLISENMTDKIDFSSAKVVIAGGWGLCQGKNTEYLEKLKKLAKKFNGVFATTRKVVEAGLADKAYQIGQTGTTTNADIYIAFGISGAIQHIQGMKNCKTIIAVNSDENADIFKYSDYKAVTDAKTVIDELLKI